MTLGGIDGHCDLDQAMTEGSKMADDFLSGTQSAFGGITTLVPFACQLRGQSLQKIVDDFAHLFGGLASGWHFFSLNLLSCKLEQTNDYHHSHRFN